MHHLIKCKKTGATQVVASLSGIDLEQWECKECCEPTEFHDVDSKGELVENKKTKDKIQKHSKNVHDRIDELETQVKSLLAEVAKLKEK